MSKEVKVVVVKTNEKDDPNFEGPDFNDIDFVEPSKWRIMNALGEMVYFCCQKREKAQEICDEMYGKGRYTVRTSSTVKTKSKLESGDYSCRGTQTR